ncbi:MAG TPA: phosphoglycerate kinase [Firmicutes bacterium]|nr:phosphoglycerate kinase [Bacillota bacterium]
MKYGMNTLDDFDVKGKTVLCRVDINSPIDPATGEPRDITRIERCVPTIAELSQRGAKVVLLAHQGGDLEYKNFTTTEPHARILSRLLGRPVDFIDDVCGPAARERIRQLGEGDILLLDNVRFMAEEMTLFETKLKLSPKEQAKTIVVRKLAPLADLYVCDAFAAVHRSQPTLVGFEEVLPSAMGRLFEEEVTALSKVRESPERPCIFVLGGAKIQDAFIIMSSVLKDKVCDEVLTSGLVANIMFMAKGVDIGKPSRDFIMRNALGEYVEMAKGILSEFGDRVVLPVDLAYVRDGRQETGIEDLPVDELIVDIGHKTVDLYCAKIREARTIFVNGPAGVFEKPESEYGTKSIWEAIAASHAFSVIGGGDSIAAVNKYGLEKGFSYISTAGGGLVRFLSGEELPVIKALKDAARRMAP